MESEVEVRRAMAKKKSDNLTMKLSKKWAYSSRS